MTLVIFFRGGSRGEARTPKHEKPSHVCLGAPTAQSSVIGTILHVFYEEPCWSIDDEFLAEAPGPLGFSGGMKQKGTSLIPASQESPTMTSRAEEKSVLNPSTG